jgi:hypothetical protein
MSGIYNYHPTIAEPESFKVQTASQQKPYYFGGSQVPINLGLENTNLNITGQGLGKKHISKMIYKPKGRFIK